MYYFYVILFVQIILFDYGLYLGWNGVKKILYVLTNYIWYTHK